jgi:ribosome maturation factor RimP
LAGVIEPLLANEGYELVLVEYVPRIKILRLYIDKLPTEDNNKSTGVTLDDCSRASRLVSDLLDAEGLGDKLGDRYTLEVSSPGLDRPLVKPRDFQRFVGRQVNLMTQEMIEGRRKFEGELLAADANQVQLQVEGRAYVIPLVAIDKARLVPNFDSKTESLR